MSNKTHLDRLQQTNSDAFLYLCSFLTDKEQRNLGIARSIRKESEIFRHNYASLQSLPENAILRKKLIQIKKQHPQFSEKKAADCTIESAHLLFDKNKLFLKEKGYPQDRISQLTIEEKSNLVQDVLQHEAKILINFFDGFIRPLFPDNEDFFVSLQPLDELKKANHLRTWIQENKERAEFAQMQMPDQLTVIPEEAISILHHFPELSKYLLVSRLQVLEGKIIDRLLKEQGNDPRVCGVVFNAACEIKDHKRVSLLKNHPPFSLRSFLLSIARLIAKRNLALLESVYQDFPQQVEQVDNPCFIYFLHQGAGSNPILHSLSKWPQFKQITDSDFKDKIFPVLLEKNPSPQKSPLWQKISGLTIEDAFKLFKESLNQKNSNLEYAKNWPKSKEISLENFKELLQLAFENGKKKAISNLSTWPQMNSLSAEELLDLSSPAKCWAPSSYFKKVKEKIKNLDLETFIGLIKKHAQASKTTTFHILCKMPQIGTPKGYFKTLLAVKNPFLLAFCHHKTFKITKTVLCLLTASYIGKLAF